ncbi:MAG: hypothetical protein QW641_01785 [Candidatus Aenigmatarchaeota archaeon]
MKKLFFWFLLVAFIIVISIMFFFGIVDIFNRLFTCGFLSSEVDDTNMDAKLKDSVKRTINVPACFDWMQGPCSIKNDLPDWAILENAEKGKTYSICGKIRDKNIIRCYDFEDVYWDTNGTLLSGTYTVIAGRYKVVFDNVCDSGNQLSSEICSNIAC